MCLIMDHNTELHIHLYLIKSSYTKIKTHLALEISSKITDTWVAYEIWDELTV